MANAIANRPGQNQGTGDARALFMEKYLTEVLAAYHTANVTEGRFMERTITEGKSAEFPVTGLAGGGVHQVGAEIVGRKIKHGNRVITIEDTIISDVFVAKIDELMNHYDLRGPYTTEQGEFLAKLNDYQRLMLAIKAARSSANIPGQTPGGTRLVDAAMKTDANVLARALFGARTQLDENGIPQSDVYGYLRPAQMALLVLNKETINKDFNGSGSYADGTIFSVGGVPLTKTTHLPQVDMSSDSAINAVAESIFGPETTAEVIPSKYRADFSTTAGVVAHKGALGTLTLGETELAMDYDFRRRGTLIVASQIKGKDILRPECAIELATANLA